MRFALAGWMLFASAGRADAQAPTTVRIPFHFGMNAYDGPIVHYGNGPLDPGY